MELTVQTVPPTPRRIFIALLMVASYLGTVVWKPAPVVTHSESDVHH